MAKATVIPPPPPGFTVVERQPARVVPSPPPGFSVVRSQPIPEEDQTAIDTRDYLGEQIAAGNIMPDQPGMWQNLQNMFPQTAGGIIGGVAGTRRALAAASGLKPPLKALAGLAGGLSGSFGGGFLGKASELGYKNKDGTVIEFEEIVGDSVVAGFEEFMGELLGFGTGKLLGKAGRAIKAKRAKPQAEGLELAGNIAREGGTNLTYSQARNSKLARVIEGFAEKFVIGGGGLRRAKLKQAAGIRKVGDQIQGEFTGSTTRRFRNRQPGEMLQSDISAEIKKQFSPTEAGKIVRDSLTGSKKTFQAAAQGLYSQVDKAVKIAGVKNKAIVDMTAVKKFIKAKYTEGQVKKVGKNLVFPPGLTKEAKKGLREGDYIFPVGMSESSKRLAKNVLNQWPDGFNFKQAGGVRTSLFLEGFDEAVIAGKSSPTEVMAKQLIERITGEMDKAGMALPDKTMVEKWRLAREFYKEGSDKFNKKIVKDLDKRLLDNPELMADELFKPEGVTAVRNAKAALGVKSVGTPKAPTRAGMLSAQEPKVWAAAKAGLVSNIFKHATSVGEDGLSHINPVKFAEKLNSYGAEVLAETFSKADMKRLNEYSSALSILTRSPGKLPGEIAIPLLQIGAFSSVALGNVGLPLAVTLGPAAVGKIAMNPRWTDTVINAARPGASQGAIVKLANLARRLAKEEKEKEKERIAEAGRNIQGQFAGAID